MTAKEIITVDHALKRRLVEALNGRDPILSFQDDPALASLCTSIALAFEIGNPEFDRLSPFFDVDVASSQENPWEHEIFIKGSDIGLRLWRKDGKHLSVRHPDLRFVLAPESLDQEGQLTQIVIFPRQVALKFEAKGFDLVIVRDWILNSSLTLDANQRVQYLLANQWEIDANIAATQAELMTKHQIPFFGTHDIVDHLLGADLGLYDGSQKLIAEVQSAYAEIFSPPGKASRMQLQISYFIGVMLDDLAQPKWYGSQKHYRSVRTALHYLSYLPKSPEDSAPTLPRAFHRLVAAVRDDEVSLLSLSAHLAGFIQELYPVYAFVTEGRI